jgi:DNA-binding NarL/FixJ family response regulator
VSRLDRIVELATRLGVARAEVARIEAELEGMLGKPDKTFAEAVAEPASKHPPSAPLANGHSRVKAKGVGTGRYPRAVSPEHAQIIALAKDGLDRAAIAAKAGIDPKTVSGHLFRARRAGALPKAGARH